MHIPLVLIVNCFSMTIFTHTYYPPPLLGSGKTTFLSVLSLRLDSRRMKIEGDIRINGKSYHKNLLKSMSGYVMQDDLIHAMLTVGETLLYTSALR